MFYSIEMKYIFSIIKAWYFTKNKIKYNNTKLIQYNKILMTTIFNYHHDGFDANKTIMVWWWSDQIMMILMKMMLQKKVNYKKKKNDWLWLIVRLLLLHISSLHIIFHSIYISSFLFHYFFFSKFHSSIRAVALNHRQMSVVIRL